MKGIKDTAENPQSLFCSLKKVFWCFLGACFTFFQLLNPAQGESPILIDDVEILGVSALSADEVEEAVAVEPGEVLKASAVEDSVHRLKELYQAAGYEAPKFKVKVFRRPVEESATDTEVVLSMEVVEGLPTRIAGIIWEQEGATTPSQLEWWSNLSRSFTNKFAMKPGDVASKERVSAGIRAVLDFLKTEDLIFAQISDPIFTLSPAPAEGAASGAAASWVSLRFSVRLGVKVGFGFRGNEAVSAFRLDNIVEEQRVLGIGKDFLAVLRSKILDEYLSLGYNHAEVEVLTREDQRHSRRQITFLIQEGSRVSIDRIEFDGNRTFPAEHLLEVFYEGASDPIRNGIFLEKDLQKAAELIVDWLKARGYLFARLVTTKTVYPTMFATDSAEQRKIKASRGNFIVYLHEGDQTVLRSLTLSGFTILAPEEAAGILGLDESAPLNLARFTEGLERLKATYRARGYLTAAIKNEGSPDIVKYSQENHFADISIEMLEGPLFRVSSIEWRGLEKTRMDVVQRELQLGSGDVIEEEKLNETERRLRLLGVFGQVTIRLEDEPTAPGAGMRAVPESLKFQKRVIISVDEATPGIIAGGFGFRTDLGIRAFGQTGYTNLLGRNHTVLLNVNVNRRVEDYRFVEGSAQLSYLWPWFLGDKTVFRPSLTVQAQQFISFDAKIITGVLTFDRKLLNFPAITIGLAYSLEYADLTIRKAELRDFDQSSPLIGSLIPSIRLDTRDSPLNPTKGISSSLSFEVASPWLGSQSKPYPVAYTRAIFRTDVHVPLPFDLRWYGSFRTGYSRNLASPVYDSVTQLRDPKSGILPLTKHFFLGGAGSVRGYKEDEINQTSIGIEGTLSYVNYRTQLSFPIVPGGNWRIGTFLDAANLNVDTFNFGDLKFGAGISFSYISPLGALNVDLAGRLNPPKNEAEKVDFIRAYFSIGFI
jgi:outer membrane protein insertion porin family